MPKKNTKVYNSQLPVTNSAIEFVTFSKSEEKIRKTPYLDKKVLAMQTSRISPFDTAININSPYQGFNLGLHVGDLAEQVVKNRQYLQELLPNGCAIQWLEQVHGNDVVSITKASSQPLIADAAVTKEKNICLAVMTADCLPILLASKQGDEIGAIHGGWRPLAANIISHTLRKMDTDASELYAWLGPCIGKTAFEVGQEVKDAFVSQNPLFSQEFTKQPSGKYLADLQGIAQWQLTLLGVKSINILADCTFSNTDKYYSYRKHNKTGRMASLICLP